MNTGDERPQRPGTDGPAPAPDDAQWREFQEFKRFQEFQRYSRAVGSTDAGTPTPADPDATPPRGTELSPGTELQPWTPAVPVQQPPPVPQVPPVQQTQPPVIEQPPDWQHQLTGMQRQLTELTEAQRAAERAANPPLWRKLLRSKLVRTAVVVAVLLIAAGVIVPQLSKSGGSTDLRSAHGAQKSELISRAQPLPQRQNRQLFSEPTDGVHYLYELTARGDKAGVPASACLAFDSAATEQRFAGDLGQPSCMAAIRSMAGRVRNPEAYANPTIPQQAEKRTGRTSVVSSCASQISGGPRLGAFTFTMQEDQTWVISDHHNEPSPCPKQPANR